MDIYSVCNQKGGVGKTFTSVNLAIGLAKQGKRVLALDLDPQGSLSISLGVKNPDQLDQTISEKLEYLINDVQAPCDPRAGILSHPEGIDYLPGNIELANMEISLVTALGREHLLGKYLDLLEEDYDVVVMDCSPSLGLVTINALSCATHVIIPVQAQFLSIKGMEQLFRTIDRVKRKLNLSLEISGILVTMANQRTKDYKETIETLFAEQGEQVRIFQSIVPLSTRAMESPKKGVSIYQHDPKGKVALAYESFIGELLGEESHG